VGFLYEIPPWTNASRMPENRRNGQDDSDIAKNSQPFTITSRNVHWTDTFFRQRTITGSNKGQRINREVISQSVLVVQNVVRNFLRSFRWAGKCLLQTEENGAREKLCYGVHACNTTVEKQIPSNCTERCSLQKLIDNMYNWNFTKCIMFLEFKNTSPFTSNSAVIVFHSK